MENDRIKRLVSSFQSFVPRAEELTDRFFANLFVRFPELRSLFPANLDAPKQRFFPFLVLVVDHLHTPERLSGPLLTLGRQHACANVTLEQYPAFRDTLVKVMADMAGDRWSEALTEDWSATIDFLASVMAKGHAIAEEFAATVPAE